MQKNVLSNFFKGAGSILDIYPIQNYEDLIPKGTPEERMRENWERVGHSMWHAIETFNHEQKLPPTEQPR